METAGEIDLSGADDIDPVAAGAVKQRYRRLPVFEQQNHQLP
ncbi:hypothetical protein OP862_01235 [Yersinia massiliensis]|nr:hypothetical protein [Yersinia massiliensis]MDA5549174.1 hypothetical protein [Yersinia massiliensis]UZM79348.1 hypothetical protein OP862_01235 [Yersinia massiliensis]